MNTQNSNIIEQVLNYWFTVEFLGQDKYIDSQRIQNEIKLLKRNVTNNNSRMKKIKNFVTIGENDNIYDVILSEAKACGMKKWGNLTFYIGKVKRETCIECIAQVLQRGEELPEKNNDKIALLSLQLSPEGRYIEHTLSLSTIIWALNQINTSEENFADFLDEKQYQKDVEELENKFFKKEAVNNDYSNNKVETDIQNFEVDAVDIKTLRDLFAEVNKTYIKKNILKSDDEDVIEEIYGISFQLFKDEDTKNNEEDDNYLGLSHDFFSDDIKLLLEKAKNGELMYEDKMESDIIQYISVPYEESIEDKIKTRIDLVNPREQGEDVFRKQISEILRVENAPLGKWPSKFMPAFMQQVAINLAIGKGKSKIHDVNGKIFSVNGPPGTGKTTLLKEIIVNNIVERAILLAQYDNPDEEAFVKHDFLHGKRENNAYSKYIRHWYTLKDDKINDYSVLVTSCNNAAVENISKELPMGTSILKDLQASDDDSEEVKALLEEVQQLFDVEQSVIIETNKKGSYKDVYFTQYARNLLNDDNAWGLIAAPLGKKSNISNFYSKVLNQLRWDFYPKRDAAKNRVAQFKEAKKLFLEQLEHVKKLQHKLEYCCYITEQRFHVMAEEAAVSRATSKKIEQHQKNVEELTQQAEVLKKKIAQKSLLLALMNIKKQVTKREFEQCKKSSAEKNGKMKDLLREELKLRNSVGILTKLFHKSKYNVTMNLADEYKKDVEQAKLDMLQLQAKQEGLSRELQGENEREKVTLKDKKKIEVESKEYERQINTQNQSIEKLEAEIKYMKEKYIEINERYQKCIVELQQRGFVDTATIIDDNFVASLLSSDNEISTKAQVSNPWLTQRYNREREKLFYYAIRLNKEFVLSSNHCRDNFITLSQYWGMESGDEKERITFHQKDKERCVAALYQTLFLLVPVISSTFASIGSFFKDIKDSGIVGTLIVDEAGQAQPQMALGSLYRSRKAIIVGDPKQVEPVVTDDLNFLKQTFKAEVLKPYKLKTLSVQEFADKLNGFGTYLDNGFNKGDWVGCPLLVHRRCISPMYDISNEISYKHIMKQQTRKPNEETCVKFIYDKSQWINVKGREKGNKNHFVDAQGKKVCEMLEIAFEKSDNPNLYIISPFTSVVFGIKTYIASYCRRTSNSNINLEWAGKNIGTVHTFQGKEANEVIFLLGCDTSKEAQGAIHWVNSNIVNVATTRAKYRLYVIGDADAWKFSGCVSTAKSIIDTFAIREIKAILDDSMPEDEKKKALALASRALPPATAFSMEEIVNEDGEIDYSVDTTSLLTGLNTDFMKVSLTNEQLEIFGFQSIEELDAMIPQVKENLLLGMKLYYLLKPVYEVNKQLDASCCAILFCKALELQMKDCFLDSLKKQFPDFKIKGQLELKNAKDNQFTLGAFCKIIKDNAGELAEIIKSMKEMVTSAYNQSWWESFSQKLKTCTELRNRCCHSGLFCWDEQSELVFNMFIHDDKRAQVKRAPKVGGILYESAVGKKLIREHTPTAN